MLVALASWSGNSKQNQRFYFCHIIGENTFSAHESEMSRSHVEWRLLLTDNIPLGKNNLIWSRNNVLLARTAAQSGQKRKIQLLFHCVRQKSTGSFDSIFYSKFIYVVKSVGKCFNKFSKNMWFFVDSLWKIYSHVRERFFPRPN